LEIWKAEIKNGFFDFDFNFQFSAFHIYGKVISVFPISNFYFSD